MPAHTIGETQVAYWATCRMTSGIYGCHVARHVGLVVERRRPACQVVTSRHLACSIAVLVSCVIILTKIW